MAATDSMKVKLEKIIKSPQSNDTIRMRARWMDNILPGKGTILERYQDLASKFVIPKEMKMGRPDR